MLVSAYADGIREIVCTPHFHYRRGHTSKEILQKTLQELQETIREKCPGMCLHLGNELYYDNELCERLTMGSVCTLAGTEYVLVEFSPQTEYAMIRKAALELVQEGFIPVIAHVERYECIVNNHKLAEELVELGALLQVNAASVLGKAGRKVKRFVKTLFRNGRVSFVATDAHDTKTRKPELSVCANYIEKKFGREAAEQCLFENPKKLICGESL